MTSQSVVATFSRGGAIQYRGHGDAEISMRKSRLRGGLRRNDRRLAEGDKPALGSHLVSPRLGFAHHGIYVGCGRVVHYGAFVHGLHRGPVEEVSLARFTHGQGEHSRQRHRADERHADEGESHRSHYDQIISPALLHSRNDPS